MGYINKTGYTQCQVCFSLDDNDGRGAGYIGWNPGGNSTAGNQPVLEVVCQ
jgi:hypothetical protein